MISKKSLIAAAVLSTMAAGAMAANVTLYGVIDESLQYTSVAKHNGTGHVNSFKMQSGNLYGSRWGMKGVEEIGSVKVGFDLQSGFDADTGAMGQGNRLFGRQSVLFVEGAYGHLAVGRFGSLTSGTGSYDVVGSYSPFGTSYSNVYTAEVGTTVALAQSRVDNAIVYKSPKFAGFQAHAMYSLKTDGKDGKGDESKPNADRYAGLAVTYANGPLQAALAVSSLNYAKGDSSDDGLTVILGANYDFGVAKLHAAVNYFDEVSAKLDGDLLGSTKGKMTGFGSTLGATIPVCGGRALIGAGYLDAEAADSVAKAADYDFKRMTFGIGYEYDVSKRTTLYSVAGYTKDKIETAADTTKSNAYGICVGVRHKF